MSPDVFIYCASRILLIPMLMIFILVGAPAKLLEFNVWHRTPEPKDIVKKKKWKKYGTYELKGRSKALAEKEPSFR